MAENDRFERSYRAVWRKAYIRARQDTGLISETSDILTKALAKNLRDWDGVPGFHKISQIIDEGAWQRVMNADQIEGASALLDAFDRLENIVREHGGHRHTRLAADAAISMIATGDLAGFDGSFSERTCEKIVNHRFFGNAPTHLVSEGRFADFEHAEKWRQDVMRSLRPQIQKIAKQLEQNPDGKGIRAPKRQTPTESTHSLLEENLVPLTHMPQNLMSADR